MMEGTKTKNTNTANKISQMFTTRRCEFFILKLRLDIWDEVSAFVGHGSETGFATALLPDILIVVPQLPQKRALGLSGLPHLVQKFMVINLCY
jgi:hypothetical protein